jgi:hypothetical protein
VGRMAVPSWIHHVDWDITVDVMGRNILLIKNDELLKKTM